MSNAIVRIIIIIHGHGVKIIGKGIAGLVLLISCVGHGDRIFHLLSLLKKIVVKLNFLYLGSNVVARFCGWDQEDSHPLRVPSGVGWVGAISCKVVPAGRT